MGSPLILGDAIEGESREVAVVMAGMARSAKQYGHPISGPAVLLSGGETTVTVNNTQPEKGAAIPSFYSVWPVRSGEHGIWAMAGDSDGIDGTEDAAGAIVFPDTLARGKLSGLNAVQYLDGHDSYCYFHALNDLLITGPTLTNVNDIRAILIA